MHILRTLSEYRYVHLYILIDRSSVTSFVVQLGFMHSSCVGPRILPKLLIKELYNVVQAQDHIKYYMRRVYCITYVGYWCIYIWLYMHSVGVTDTSNW